MVDLKKEGVFKLYEYGKEERILLKKRNLFIGFLVLLLSFILTNVASAQNTYEYVYDDNNKLTEIKKDGNIIMTFTYDSNGNMTKKLVSLLGQPTNLTAPLSQITSNIIQLSWNAVQDASEYYIYQNGVKLATSSPTNEFNVTNLSPNTNYTFQVTAMVNGSESDKSNLINAKTLLEGPTNLTAPTMTNSSVQLNWTAVTGANSYNIYQNGIKLVTFSSTNSFNVTNLSPNTDYNFQVSAIIGDSESDKSNLINVKTLLQGPTNLVASTITNSSVQLNWTAVSGASSYKIYQNGITLVTSSLTNSFNVTNLSPNTNYTFQVTAMISSSESGKSNQISIKTSPPAPTGLQVNDITTNSLTLSWSSVSGASTYYVYQKESSGSMYTQIATTILPSINIQNLSPGTTYSFVVRSFNGSLGPQSNEIVSTTLNAPDSDTFEPNNSIATAYYFDPGRIDSFVYSALDVDYYKILAEVSGTINLELISPYLEDYDIYLYSDSGQLLSSGLGINRDRITYNTNGGYFYIKIVGHNSSYSTSNVYSLDYQFTQGTGGGAYCPPGHVCTDEGETMMSFTSEEDTALTSSEPFSLSITPEQSLTLENLYLPEVTFDKKVEAYLLLSEIGAYGDIQWLEEKLKITSDPRELRLIKWTLAKIGYKHSKNKPEKAYYFIATLLDEEDEGIQEWIYEKLVELTDDPKSVEKFLKRYKEKKEKE
jgi:YD repeat-containing protein